MRAITWLLFCIVSYSVLTTPARAKPPMQLDGPQADSWVIDPHMTPSEERQILTSLDQPVRLGFIDEPLSDVVRHLIQRFPDCRLALDVRSLEEIGLAGDIPVTIHFSGTLGQALEVILQELDLTLCLRGNMLWITIVETAEEKLATRIYDVTDLIAEEHSWRQLFRTIESTIEPDTWEALGGPSTFAPQQAGNRGLLVVSAPTVVQMQLQRLLDRLTSISRGASVSQIPRPSRAVSQSYLPTRRASAPPLARPTPTAIHKYETAKSSRLPRFRLP